MKVGSDPTDRVPALGAQASYNGVDRTLSRRLEMKYLSALILALLFLGTPALAVDTLYCPSGGGDGDVCPGGDDGDICPGGDDGDICPGDDGEG